MRTPDPDAMLRDTFDFTKKYDGILENALGDVTLYRGEATFAAVLPIMKWCNDIHSLVDIIYIHPSLAEAMSERIRKCAPRSGVAPHRAELGSISQQFASSDTKRRPARETTGR